MKMFKLIRPTDMIARNAITGRHIYEYSHCFYTQNPTDRHVYATRMNVSLYS